MDYQAIEQLVQNIRARDIAAFPVIHADAQEDEAAVCARMNDRDFSHMPIRDPTGRVTGVFDRVSRTRTTLEEAKHVIEAAAPLVEAIKRLPEAGFLLVSSPESEYPDKIHGIINHADVVTLPVRLLIYTRTMLLERRVLDAIKEKDWGKAPKLKDLWRKADEKYQKGGEQRSAREAYLGFPDLMLIGQELEILQVSNDDRKRLRIARNFASHEAIDAPTNQLHPEVIIREVEQCVRLVERLLRNGT